MKTKLNEEFTLISTENDINEFIENNAKTLEILDAMKPQLRKHFPNTKLSLEICDELTWTSEKKILLNVHVGEEMFFNGMLTHFNDIYAEINPLIKDILCPVVLFPELENEHYDKIGKNSAINLIARTAYFNNDYDQNFQREMTLHEIPKEKQVKEILNYCKTHKKPNISEMVFDLRLDIFDVDRIIDELENKGINLDIEY